MEKAVFQPLDLSIKCSRPFPSDLKTDQEALLARKVIFEILEMPTILHLLVLCV